MSENPAERAPRKPTTYGCGGCTNRWRGVSRAHCAACHKTWSSVSGFDAHRRDVNGKGTCLDPAVMRTKAGELIFRFDAEVWKFAAEYDRDQMQASA